jgi:hypothetical protein
MDWKSLPNNLRESGKNTSSATQSSATFSKDYEKGGVGITQFVPITLSGRNRSPAPPTKQPARQSAFSAIPFEPPAGISYNLSLSTNGRHQQYGSI